MSSTQRNIDAQYGAKEVLVYDPSVSQVDVLLSGLDSGVQPQAVTSNDALAQIEIALQQPGLKTLHVLGQAEHGRRAVRPLVGPDAFEGSETVVKRMRQNVDVRRLPVDELSV